MDAVSNSLKLNNPRGALVILNMYQAKKQPATTEMPAKALGKKAISAMDFYQADARGIMYNVE